MNVICYDTAKDKNVTAGSFDNRVFTKLVNRKKHFFRIISGYAIEKEVIERLEKLGCNKIIIKERDTKDILTISFSDFLLHKGSWRAQNTISEKFFNKKHEGY